MVGTGTLGHRHLIALAWSCFRVANFDVHFVFGWRFAALVWLFGLDDWCSSEVPG